MWSERLKTVKEGLAMLTCFIYMKPLGKTRWLLKIQLSGMN
jgi:hypothetical protein